MKIDKLSNDDHARADGIAAAGLAMYQNMAYGYGPFYAYRDAADNGNFVPGTDASVAFMAGWNSAGGI